MTRDYRTMWWYVRRNLWEEPVPTTKQSFEADQRFVRASKTWNVILDRDDWFVATTSSGDFLFEWKEAQNGL